MAIVKTKSDELSKILQDVGTVIYQQAAAAEKAQQQAQAGQQQQQAGPQEQPSQQAEEPSGEKVVDSEDYKVK